MIKPFTIRKYIFTIIFWFAFGVFLWLNFQSDDGKLNAFFQTCAILISSFIFTQLLTVKLLPKALRSRKMKWFLIQAILIILSLSILFSLIFTYIRIDRSTPLPANFSDQIPLLWKGFICLFLLFSYKRYSLRNKILSGTWENRTGSHSVTTGTFGKSVKIITGSD